MKSRLSIRTLEYVREDVRRAMETAGSDQRRALVAVIMALNSMIVNERRRRKFIRNTVGKIAKHIGLLIGIWGLLSLVIIVGTTPV